MNGDACNCCGLEYQAMRTGHTYQDVYAMLWSANSDSRTWRYKGRSGVLGKWHEIKKGLWAHHLDMCEQNKAVA